MPAIEVCTFTGNINAAELLLEHGADINADSSAGPPLFLAAGTPPEPSLLVSDALSFISTYHLYAGCPAGHQEEDMAAFLIGHGADVDAADDKGVSACLLAAATGASFASLSMAHHCFKQPNG
jgi:ankyrin repeat protein